MLVNRSLQGALTTL